VEVQRLWYRLDFETGLITTTPEMLRWMNYRATTPKEKLDEEDHNENQRKIAALNPKHKFEPWVASISLASKKAL